MDYSSPSTSSMEVLAHERIGIGDLSLELEKDLTKRFLNGEISFADYSSEWYEKSQEDEDAAAGGWGRRAVAAPALSDDGVKRRRRTHLTPALVGLMGEANIRWVRGDRITAEKMCHEIIRQVPTAAEPYQTLAQIYENDADKCLQYSLLAAHLSPSDADEWIRLAEISKQRNEVKQEMICYTQAIKADPRHLPYHVKRIQLIKQLETISYPIQNLRVSLPGCYHKIVKSIPPSDSSVVLEYAKLAASLYHQTNELEKALEVMRDAYDKCAFAFSLEDLNLLLELLISQKQHQACVEALVTCAGVEVEAYVHTISDGDTVHDQTQFVACRIPEELPIDLRTKLLVCFVHLKATDIVVELIGEFLHNDVEKTGDLYMDVEEALSAVGEHGLALRLLEPLVRSQHFSLGAVWLRHAECLIQLGREEDAVHSLNTVIEVAPQHVDARRKLFAILEKTGRRAEAISTLQQDYSKTVSSALMYEHCLVLKEQNDLDKFLEVGEALLSRSFMRYRHPEELKMARLMRSTNQVADIIYNFRKERDEYPFDPDGLAFDSDDNLTPDVEWGLLQELLAVAYHRRNYVAMQRLSFGAFTSKVISNRRHEIEFLCLQSCILNNDYRNAYPIVKDFVVKFPEYPRVWNLLNLVKQTDEDQNQIKFLMRLFEKNKSSVPQLNLFLGNSYLSSGRYQTALGYFLEYHENVEQNALGALLIGVTMLIMACQRSVDKHHSLILQGISYLLSYKKMRNHEQESCYNLARAYHMLSLNNLAVHYYEKALAAPSLDCDDHRFVNVRREAAFNLYLLYKNTSPALARMQLQNYKMQDAMNQVCPANLIPFEEISNLCEKLFNNKKNRSQQDTLLTDYINAFRVKAAQTSGENKNTSFFPILRLLLPKLDRARPAYDLKEDKLGKLYRKVLLLHNKSRDAQKLLNFRAARGNQHGSDFASIAYSVLQSGVSRPGDLTVGTINEYLDKVANAEAGTKAQTNCEVFTEVLVKTTPQQHKWWIRIILKDMKLEMGHKRILACFHPDAPEQYELCQDIFRICEELDEGDSRPAELGVQLFSAVSPMLSERLDVTHVATLPANTTYHIENKFDGERFQMHMSNGVFAYYSRRAHSYTEQYGASFDSDGMLTPRLRDCFDPAVESFILDGEMMGWHKEKKCFSSKGMAFDVKKITPNSKFQPCFCPFDILYHNGRCLVGASGAPGALPLARRLQLLDTLFSDVQGAIVHSKREPVKEREEILDALNKAIEDDEEGIIVKDVNSYYIANRRNAGWYKVKPEYTDGVMVELDLMIVGADYAQNSVRSGLAKSFFLALAVPPQTPGEMPSRWLSLGRVASGLTHEQRQQLCAELARNWKPLDKHPAPACLQFTKDKPELWIHPQHSCILQVKASELIRSTYYAAGYTLRFPRITRVRDDKPLQDAMTIEDMEKLVQGRSVEKLAGRHVSADELAPEARASRKRKAKSLEVAEAFRPAEPPVAAEVSSRALHGRKLWVLSGDDLSSKDELEKLVISHGGTPVQNKGSDTWLCVAGKRIQRVQNALESGVDVVGAEWLRRLAPGAASCAPPAPLDMLAISRRTRTALARHYDPLGDSYTAPANEETLRKCFAKMDDGDRVYLNAEEKLVLDRELYDGANPFSCLRACSVYAKSERLRLKARALGGHVGSLESRVTHVIWDEAMKDCAKFKKNAPDALLVTEGWLEKCFESRAKVNEAPYLVL